jgi:hypothetical protein
MAYGDGTSTNGGCDMWWLGTGNSQANELLFRIYDAAAATHAALVTTGNALTQATAADRVKIYIDGSENTLEDLGGGGPTYPAQNDTMDDASYMEIIGGQNGTSTGRNVVQGNFFDIAWFDGTTETLPDITELYWDNTTRGMEIRNVKALHSLADAGGSSGSDELNDHVLATDWSEDTISASATIP